MSEVYFSETGETLTTEGYDDPSLEQLERAADASGTLERLEQDIDDYRRKMMLYGQADQLLEEGYDAEDHVLFYLKQGDEPLPWDGYVIGERLDRLDRDLDRLAEDIWAGVDAFVDDPGEVDDRVQELYHVAISTFSGDAAADDVIEDLRDRDYAGYKALSRLADRHRTPQDLPETGGSILDRTIAQAGAAPNGELLTAVPAITAMEGLPRYIEDVAACVAAADEDALRDELEAHLDQYQEDYTAEQEGADAVAYLDATLETAQARVADAEREALERLAVRTTHWALAMEELGRAITAVAVDRRDARVDDTVDVPPQPFALSVNQELEPVSDTGSDRGVM